MLIYKSYIELITKHYYIHLHKLRTKLKFVTFLNLTFKTDQKLLFFYQVYIYFFFCLNFGYVPIFILLSKAFRRYSVSKRYLIGVKLDNHNSTVNQFFLNVFNSWYYYNIFGDLKIFFSDKKGGFFYVKFPLLNLNYLLNYNIITLLLYNLNIPNVKYLVSTTYDKNESLSIRFLLGFF